MNLFSFYRFTIEAWHKQAIRTSSRNHKNTLIHLFMLWYSSSLSDCLPRYLPKYPRVLR